MLLSQSVELSTLVWPGTNIFMFYLFYHNSLYEHHCTENSKIQFT